MNTFNVVQNMTGNDKQQNTETKHNNNVKQNKRAEKKRDEITKQGLLQYSCLGTIILLIRWGRGVGRRLHVS